MRTALLALALTATSLPSLGAQNVPDLAGHWTLLGIVERGRFTPSTWTNEYSQHIEIVQEGENMMMIRRWPNGMTTVRPFRVGTTTTFSDGHRWRVRVKSGGLVIEQLPSETWSADLYAGRNMALNDPRTLFAHSVDYGPPTRVMVSPAVPYSYRASPDGTTLEVKSPTTTGRYRRTGSTER
jgi:hypothetical protein